MIEIKRVTDVDFIKSIVDVDDGDIFFAAFEAGEMTGYCRCRLDGETVTLIDLVEKNGDMLIADAVARAAVAACRGAGTVEYNEENAFLVKYCGMTGEFAAGKTPADDFLKGTCGMK